MRTERINISTTDIDIQEQNWWNKHAKTIEKIWAQTQAIQNIIRLPYLKKMKSFFVEDKQDKKINIIEIGCGTGWVCRNIADENTHIIGTDFSIEQIKLAQENAKLDNKNNYCTYELATTDTFVKNNIDGVVIHAVLHHLSQQELIVFFDELNKLKSGVRLFVYEPVFPDNPIKKAGIREKFYNRILLLLKSISFFLVKKLGSLNTDLYNEMNYINIDADKNNWYISPKEVPFKEGEVEKLFGNSYHLNNKYVVNYTDLAICQQLAFYQLDQNPPFVFRKILIPLASKFDKLLFKNNYKPFIYKNTHIFVCFEFIKK